MAFGKNVICLFGTLGQPIPPHRGNSIGTFKQDAAQNIYITINEASCQGKDTYLNDGRSDGGNNVPSAPIVSSGAYDKIIETIASQFNVCDDANSGVGKAYALNIDRNRNSRAHEDDECIGHVLVRNTIRAEIYTVSPTYAFSKDISDVQNSEVFLPASFSASGMLIATQNGDVPIEELNQGELILTLDNGDRPLRWVESSKQLAISQLAPIQIPRRASAIARDACVSTHHQIRLADLQVKLFLVEMEILATANSVIKYFPISRDRPKFIKYFCIFLDTHQIIYSDGCPTESFDPDWSIWGELRTDTRAETLTLLPELERHRMSAHGSPCRACLEHSEAGLFDSGFAMQGRWQPHSTIKEFQLH